MFAVSMTVLFGQKNAMAAEKNRPGQSRLQDGRRGTGGYHGVMSKRGDPSASIN